MGVKRGSDRESETTNVRWPNPGQDASAIPPKLLANKLACLPNPIRESNPVPFDRLKSAVSLGAAIEPRARKHRTRSRAPVGLTVVDVQWRIALSASVLGHCHAPRGRARQA